MKKRYHGRAEIAYFNKASSGDCIRNSEDLNNKDIARQGEVGMAAKQKRARCYYDAKLIPSSETCKA